MIYELRHNNDPVLLFEINESYKITNILEIINKDLVPIGVTYRDNISFYDLNDWISSRGIPEKREGLNYILDMENVNSVYELIYKNNALGLTDHYWVAEKNSPLNWNDINYFENDDRFDKLGDDIYIGAKIENIDQGRTPSSSASGMQPKRWILHKGIKYLIKGFEEEVSMQEPYSEVAASLILDKLDIEHIEYKFYDNKGEITSACPLMLNNNEELIPAYFVSKNINKSNNDSELTHYIKCCNELGITGDLKTKLDQMIVVDYLIANTDRHWNNFSIVRDANTLKGLRLAPLYDHGAAFFTKYHHRNIAGVNINLECKSFRSTQDRNIKLVDNIDWLKKDILNDIPDITKDIMIRNINVSDKRADIIVTNISKRVNDFKVKFDIPLAHTLS